MNSRALNKKIRIMGVQSVSNGFGGSTVSNFLISNTWAQIKSLSAGKNWNLSDMGLIQSNNNLLVTVRRNSNIAYSAQRMFFVYRGKEYTIASAPTNIDFDDRFITFIGSSPDKKGNVNDRVELIQNGDFASGSDHWTEGNEVTPLTIVEEVAWISALSSGLQKDIVMNQGSSFRLAVDASGTINSQQLTVTGYGSNQAIAVQDLTEVMTRYQWIFTAEALTSGIVLTESGGSGTMHIDNVSLNEII